MNGDEALKIVDRIEVAAVKARSNGFESVGDDEVGRFILQDLEPWLYDPDKCILRATELVRERGSVDWMELRNLCMIVHRTPSIGITYTSLWGEPPPEPAEIVPWK